MIIHHIHLQVTWRISEKVGHSYETRSYWTVGWTHQSMIMIIIDEVDWMNIQLSNFWSSCSKDLPAMCSKTNFMELLRAGHSLRSKMNKMPKPILPEIWNPGPFRLNSDCRAGQNFTIGANPDLLRTLRWSGSKHHLNSFSSAHTHHVDHKQWNYLNMNANQNCICALQGEFLKR